MTGRNCMYRPFYFTIPEGSKSFGLIATLPGNPPRELRNPYRFINLWGQARVLQKLLRLVCLLVYGSFQNILPFSLYILYFLKGAEAVTHSLFPPLTIVLSLI